METHSRFPMEASVKIIRRSIYVFLQNYQSFTLNAAFIALPFAALALLAEVFVPSLPIFGIIYNRLQSVIDAAGYPRSVDLFSLLNLKLSHTFATSFVVLPFTLTFFLLAKAFTIRVLCIRKNGSKPLHTSWLSYKSLLLTQLCNILVLISANATCLFLLLFTFTCIDGLGFSSSKCFVFFSAIGAFLYSIILANALVICYIALTISGIEKRGGYLPILKACVLIKGRAATALSLALFVNILLAAVQALFQLRIVRSYQNAAKPFSLMAMEGIFIAYLYSILLVLDTVIGCTFYTSCKPAAQTDQEGRMCYFFETEESDYNPYIVMKSLEQLP